MIILHPNGGYLWVTPLVQEYLDNPTWFYIGPNDEQINPLTLQPELDEAGAWAAILGERDNLLRETDWVLSPDAPLAINNLAEWVTYRQSLRDIQQAYPTPDLVVWPDPPTITVDTSVIDNLLAGYTANTGARQWYNDNPNAALLFTLLINDLVAEIDALDLSALPAGTANKLKLLLKTLSIAVRVFAKREGFTA